MMEKNENINSILINMYCGQLPADKVAVVIKEAYEKKYCTKPMVCRIKGTNSNDANQIIQSLPTSTIVCEQDLAKAAQLVVEMGKMSTTDEDVKHKYNINPVG